MTQTEETPDADLRPYVVTTADVGQASGSGDLTTTLTIPDPVPVVAEVLDTRTID